MATIPPQDVTGILIRGKRTRSVTNARIGLASACCSRRLRSGTRLWIADVVDKRLLTVIPPPPLPAVIKLSPSGRDYKLPT